MRLAKQISNFSHHYKLEPRLKAIDIWGGKAGDTPLFKPHRINSDVVNIFVCKGCDTMHL